MTKHIKNELERLLIGGFVNKALENYINELSKFRHPSSIETEFAEALADIESKKGQMHPSNRMAIDTAIEKIWSGYPKGEKQLYKTGTTTQIENGVKVTKTYREVKIN